MKMTSKTIKFLLSKYKNATSHNLSSLKKVD